MEDPNIIKSRGFFEDELLKIILRNIEDSYGFFKTFQSDLITFKLLFIILKKLAEPKLSKDIFFEILLKKIDKLNNDDEIALVHEIKDNHDDYIMIGTLSDIKKKFAFKGTNSLNDGIKKSIDNLQIFLFNGSLFFEKYFWFDNILFIKSSQMKSHIKKASKVLKNYELKKIFDFKGNNKNSLIFYFILQDLKNQSIKYNQKEFKIPLKKIRIWFKSKSANYKNSNLKNSILKIVDQLKSEINVKISFDDSYLIIKYEDK